MSFRTRFAPSPTGPLHLGHAYSALLAYDMAMEQGGEFLLRIEDIDQSRSRPEWEQQIYEDLHWLGVSWSAPVMRQSDRLDRYKAATISAPLADALYACNCTRADIKAALSAPQEGVPLHGPDGLIYPGTCRPQTRKADWNDADTLRLNLSSLFNDHNVAQDVSWQETGEGPSGETGRQVKTSQDMLRDVGDIVIRRKGMGTSYHLSVVLDDAAQGITHVIRGADLFEATQIHVLLQKLLGLPTPIYHHHKLIRDEQGKRLAKRDDARAISKYRQDGYTPQDIRKLVGL